MWKYFLLEEPIVPIPRDTFPCRFAWNEAIIDQETRAACSNQSKLRHHVAGQSDEILKPIAIFPTLGTRYMFSRSPALPHLQVFTSAISRTVNELSFFRNNIKHNRYFFLSPYIFLQQSGFPYSYWIFGFARLSWNFA